MDKLKREHEQNRIKKERAQEAANRLSDDIAAETETLKKKQAEFAAAKAAAEEEKIKLERNQQNENRIAHEMRSERDRAHNLQLDLAELELNVTHATQDRKHHQVLVI